MGKQILITRTDKLFAVREEQRCRSRRAARSFAKSNAVVREEQRGRSRTVNKNDKCSVLKKVDRLNLESDIGLHWKSLFLYEFTHCKDNPK